MRGETATVVADRFIKLAGGCARDLATGQPVRLCLVPRSIDARTWASRCARLFSLRHPHLVSLVDYGIVARDDRFEAFEASLPVPRPQSRPSEGSGVASAVRFLGRLGLSAGRQRWRRVVDVEGVRKLLPDQSTGLPLRDDRSWMEVREAGGSADDRWCTSDPEPLGLVLQPRGVDRALAEWLETEQPALRAAVVCGPPGSGVSTTLATLMREARVRGFVPVASAMLEHRYSGRGIVGELLAGPRCLLVVHDARDVASGTRDSANRTLARVLTRLSFGGARCHTVLIAAYEPLPDLPYFELEPLPAMALRDMLRGMSPAWLRRRGLGERARWARGNPGRLAGLLTGGRRQTAAHPRVPAVAEVRAEYDARHHDAPDLRPDVTVAVDQCRARERIELARGLAERGRHAAAERALRDALGALTRRGDHRYAGLAGFDLGRLLLARGRAASAADIFHGAARSLDEARSTELALLATTFAGLARIDDGRVADAEAELRAALIASERSATALRSRVALALARCLHWRDRQTEARALLATIDPEDAGDRLPGAIDGAVAAAALLARVELADRDLHQAGLAAQGALDAAAARGEPLAGCVALRAAALVGAAAGNLQQVQAHVEEGMRGARRAHAPLMAVRLRAILTRALAAAGRTRDAAAAARPLERLNLSAIPRLTAALVRQALAQAGGPDAARLSDQAVVFARHAGAALLLADVAHRRSSRPSVIDDVIDLLYLCQDVDDEREALGRVGGMVRERTRASGVAFLGMSTAGLSVLSASGSRTGKWAAARRAVDSGLVIPAGRQDHGIETAAPIRYGAATVGALACRWTPEGPADAMRAEALIAATAAACAPWVRVALDRAAHAVQSVVGEPELMGVSDAASELRAAVARAAAAPFPVLIEGESGSGKELVARAVHRLGPRRDRRFCPLNCAALTDDLFESELFGHARGSFTGAMSERRGLFEEADGGVLFLDEVGELSPRGQAKLLRVLQEGEIRRIGENVGRTIDVRIVAATNRSLAADVAAGRFRRDLLYRLDVIRIVVPPLRARVEDIPVLVHHFWKQTARRLDSQATLSPAVVGALARYEWPGNVRELQNVLAALAVSGPRRGSIGASRLPRVIALHPAATGPATLEAGRREFETRFVRAALARAGGHRSRAARELGLSRQGLAKLLERLRLVDVPVTT